MNRINTILARIYDVMDFVKDSEFCEKYQIKNNTLSTWKKRDTIPYEFLEKISQNENYSLDWLLTGKGEMFLTDIKAIKTIDENNLRGNFMLKERLKGLRKALGMSSAKELAITLNVAEYKIKDIESGKVKSFKAEYAETLEEKFSINGWWLLTGKGKMFLTDIKEIKAIKTIDENNNLVVESTYNQENIVQIPYYKDTYAAAGDGAINYDESPIAMSFDIDFLRLHFNISSVKGLHIINSIGNSMMPTLKENELLFVNPFENEVQLVDGGIYVIAHDNGTLVKRVNHNPITMDIVLVSDNKSVDNIHITREEFKSCKIIGRVVGHFSGI
jgi:phage repressor protein C with HTH and peptisase S24 domain